MEACCLLSTTNGEISCIGAFLLGSSLPREKRRHYFTLIRVPAPFKGPQIRPANGSSSKRDFSAVCIAASPEFAALSCALASLREETGAIRFRFQLPEFVSAFLFLHLSRSGALSH